MNITLLIINNIFLRISYQMEQNKHFIHIEISMYLTPSLFDMIISMQDLILSTLK